jgi:hypothetical protein
MHTDTGEKGERERERQEEGPVYISCSEKRKRPWLPE